MAPNTNIFDNDNENSIDPNPYAYPYFHSNESTPLLYHLIVTHFGNSSDPLLLNHYQSLLTSSTTDADADTTTDSGTGAASSSAWSSASSQMTSPGTGMLHSEKTIARRIKFIGRRIQSRCKGRPQEAKWVDSCGENALFRFCQLVRFRKEMEGDEDVLERIQKMDADLASSSYYSSPSKRKLKLDSTAELIFFILKCLINVDKNALSTLNKWGETPCHGHFSTVFVALDSNPEMSLSIQPHLGSLSNFPEFLFPFIGHQKPSHFGLLFLLSSFHFHFIQINKS